jgi:hypothetical protein
LTNLRNPIYPPPEEVNEMRRIDWDHLIRCLALVHVGQSLGCDSQVSRAVHEIIGLISTLAKF